MFMFSTWSRHSITLQSREPPGCMGTFCVKLTIAADGLSRVQSSATGCASGGVSASQRRNRKARDEVDIGVC